MDTSEQLPFVRLKRGDDEAIVHLLGACVTSYKTKDTEWLALRADAKMDGSKAISGGLPHCFPKFGPPLGDLPQHGFSRNMEWKLLEERSEAGACVMQLTDTEETRKMWPHAFCCEYTVALEDGQLATTLKVENTSASDFNFTTALHSYYKVSDINTLTIQGNFQGKTRLNRLVDPPTTSTADSDTIKILEWTDAAYKEVLPGSVRLEDPMRGTLEIVSGGGWRDVVVWNPYGDNSVGADGFVCVESAALAPVPLAKGGIWEATMNLVPKALTCSS